MIIIAGVILYRPDESVFDRIKEYSNVFNKVIVYDNTEKRTYHYPSIENVTYLTNGSNDGLPHAYNIIIDTLKDVRFDYLCMLDQDSHYESDQISYIVKFIEKSTINKVAIYAPAIQYRYHTTLTEKEYEMPEWVITSGTFIDINIIRYENLRFDENYFIDRFEVDMCKQLRLLGYIIIQVNSSVLKQELGTDSGYRHPNHSPLRHYYLARNRLYFNRKYYRPIKRWFLDLLQSLRHVILIALYEKNPSPKIQACCIGWRDHIRKSYGKTNSVS